MGERQTTYIHGILHSKWLGLMLLGLGILQMAGAVLYVWLFPHLTTKNPFQDLVIIVYAMIALAILVVLSLLASLRLLFRHKNEEELGIAVFGILIDLLAIAYFLKEQLS